MQRRRPLALRRVEIAVTRAHREPVGLASVAPMRTATGKRKSAIIRCMQHELLIVLLAEHEQSRA